LTEIKGESSRGLGNSHLHPYTGNINRYY